MLINALVRTSFFFFFFSNLVLSTVTEMGLALEEATGQTGGNFRAGLFSS